SWGAGQAGSAALGLGQLVLHHDRAVERPVVLLRAVGVLDLGEVQAELVGGHRVAALRPAGLVAGDQHVRQDDRVVLVLLARPLLADVQLGGGAVLAGGTGLGQRRRRLVHTGGEVQVLEAGPADARAARVGVGAGVGHAPTERADLD